MAVWRAGRVAFLEDHDVVGDLNGGVRLVTAIDPATPNSYRARKLPRSGPRSRYGSGSADDFPGRGDAGNQAFSSSRPVDWSKTNTTAESSSFTGTSSAARRDLNGYTPGLEGDYASLLQVDNANKWSRSIDGNRAADQSAVVIANFAAPP